MAICFTDSFDHYATGDKLEKWTQSYVVGAYPEAQIVPGIGRRNTSAIRFMGNTSVASMQALGLTKSFVGDTLILQMAFGGFGTGGSWGQILPYFNTVSTLAPWSVGLTQNQSPGVICSFRQGGQTQIGFIADHQNGQISVARGDGVPFFDTVFCGDHVQAILGSTTQALPWGQFNYLQIKVRAHATLGTVEIRVNYGGNSSDVWLSLTGQNTIAPGQTAGFDEVIIGQLRGVATGSNVPAWVYDDLLIIDQDTSDPNNQVIDYVDDARIDWRAPTADGAMVGWTPSSGSDHFAMVDDNPPDDDTTVNATTAAGAIDTFQMENAPVAGINVVAVNVIHSSKRTGGGATSTGGIVRIGGGNYATPAPQGDASTYTFHSWITTTKPSDSTPYSEADFNALEVGYKKVT